MPVSLLPVTLEQARLAQAAREDYHPLDPNLDVHTIPWEAYVDFLEATKDVWTMKGRRAKYWQAVRVMTAHLQWTGCRVAELDKMTPQKIFGNACYWHLGKNQKTVRKEYLPDAHLRELDEYRKQNRVPEGKLFGITADTYRRYFNRFVRPLLGARWNRQVVTVRQRDLVLDYELQLRGFRKNFQTILFAELWAKYDEANVAILMVSKRMHHSSVETTGIHYVQDCKSKRLNVEAWLAYWRDTTFSLATQTQLSDYAVA